MKRTIAVVLTLMLGISLLVGCGGGGGSAGSVSGEVYDAGNVSALVPKGWKVYPIVDVFDDYDGEYDPNGLSINKGAKGAFDQLTTPGLQIKWYASGDGPNNEYSKAFYDDVEDLAPMTIGSRTWKGFTAVSIGYPLALLWTEEGDIFQVTVWLENGGKKISLDDADVRAILESIQAT